MNCLVSRIPVKMNTKRQDGNGVKTTSLNNPRVFQEVVRVLSPVPHR